MFKKLFSTVSVQVKNKTSTRFVLTEKKDVQKFVKREEILNINVQNSNRFFSIEVNE